MSESWPLVPLGEVIIHRKQFVFIDDTQTYKRCRVQLHAKGVVLRDTVSGAEIKTKQQQICRTGEFLVAEIDAKVGGFGIVPKELAGAVVSSHYFLFEIASARLDTRWLHYMIQTPPFRDQVSALGSTNYAAIRPRDVLGYTIPLPPFPDQQRIVARIEELTGKIERAKAMRRQTSGAIEQIKAAQERHIWSDATLQNAPMLRDVTTYLTRGRHSQQGESKHFLIKTQHVQMGRYVRTNMTLDADVAATVNPAAITRQGDILIACSAAGCLGRVAVYDDTERTASTDTHIAIARADENQILPEYLYAYLYGAQGQFQLRTRERGDWQREKIGFRLTELNLRDLERVPVPLPPKDEQQRIVAYLAGLEEKVDAVKKLQQRTQAELDALLPSVLDKAFRGEL